MGEKKNGSTNTPAIIALVVMILLILTGTGFVVYKIVTFQSQNTAVQGVENQEDQKEPGAEVQKVDKEPEIEVEERFNSVHGLIVISAKKGYKILATYYYWINAYEPDLDYDNSLGDRINLELDKNDNVLEVKLLEERHKCSNPENKNLCEKAAEKVEYWKSVLEWDKRVPQILEQEKNKKPEDYLD